MGVVIMEEISGISTFAAKERFLREQRQVYRWENRLEIEREVARWGFDDTADVQADVAERTMPCMSIGYDSVVLL
jgi:hypothetical protein